MKVGMEVTFCRSSTVVVILRVQFDIFNLWEMKMDGLKTKINEQNQRIKVLDWHWISCNSQLREIKSVAIAIYKLAIVKKARIERNKVRIVRYKLAIQTFFLTTASLSRNYDFLAIMTFSQLQVYISQLWFIPQFWLFSLTVFLTIASLYLSYDFSTLTFLTIASLYLTILTFFSHNWEFIYCKRKTRATSGLNLSLN